MKLENDNIIIDRDWASYVLRYELKQISYWASEDSKKMEYHQNLLEGMLNLLDLPPVEFNIMMRLVRRVPTNETIEAALKTLFTLFGTPSEPVKEVLDNGSNS